MARSKRRRVSVSVGPLIEPTEIGPADLEILQQGASLIFGGPCIIRWNAAKTKAHEIALQKDAP